MEKWLTITQITKRTGIPETTIKNYINTFSDHFIYKNESSRENTIYHPDSCEKVLRIYDLFQKDHSKGEVEKALQEEFSNESGSVSSSELEGREVIKSDNPSNQEKIREKNMASNIQAFTEAFEKIVEQREEINRLRERLDKLEKEQNEMNQKYSVEITRLKRGQSKRDKKNLMGFSGFELSIITLIVSVSVVIAIMIFEFFI